MWAQLPLSLDGVGHLALDSVRLGLRLGDEADAVGLHVQHRHRLPAPLLPGARTWTRKSRSSSALGHLEDRWREEEREMGITWACPGWEVERSRVEKERSQRKGGDCATIGEGKGGDCDEPEYTPGSGDGCTPVLRDVNVHAFDGAGVREAEGGRGGADEAGAVSPSGGVDVGVGGRIRLLVAKEPRTVCRKNPAGGPEIPARSAGLCALIPVASTKHIAGGRGREPGDGAGVVKRHRREKEGWSQSHWFLKHNVLTWIIFRSSVSFDSAFTCSSVILAEALTALQIVSKPTRSWSIAPTSGGWDDERERGGPGA
ncbi:hypothetical protein C8F04DRAFT_1193374 [Mycena alexandri]|uniref:Uncharacterized protein n=1 Tax=Mycena alexandri TaxID=1745969 RepID=A0AAD6S9E8_9AGAR|nr:hypothetical protein C8F04DRAFT_1193374 [Mycena alexandri]